MYAILSHGGRQFRVSAGDRLLVDRLAAEVGSVVALEPLLLIGGEGEKTTLGKDLEGMRVAATVVAHRRGKKLRIFKYKAKKRSRKVAGYRSDLTELRVESILAKGAALPTATAGNGAAAPQADDHPAETTEKKAASARTKSATATATADKPARATKATAKTETIETPAPVDEASAVLEVADAPQAAVAGEPAPQPKAKATPAKPKAKAAPAKPATTAAARPKTKAAPKPKPAKEKDGDGA